MGSNGRVGSHKEGYTDGPTIIVGRKGSIGAVNFVEETCWPIDTTYYVDATCTNQDARWLYWQLKQLRLDELNKSAAVPGLNREDAYRTRLRLPPLPEQRRIASTLDEAQSLREGRVAAIHRLGVLSKGIFETSFGTPDVTHWPVGTVADLIGSASYGTSAKAGVDGDYVVLRMGNLTATGALDLIDLKRIDIAEKDRERYLVQTDDVLFNRTNSAELVGKSARYSLSEPMAYAGYLVRLRPKPGYSGHYLAGFLNSRWAKERLRGMAKSIVGMANINAKEVQSIPAPIPSAEAQAEFAALSERMENLRALERSHLGTTDELFASLQHRAFRGEL